MPGNNMGQMIQMITSLAEMQDRRRQIALEEQKFDEQKTQFAQTLGFQEKSKQQADAFKLIDLASHGGADGVVALKQLAVSMGMGQDQAEQISHIGMDAGSALQRIQGQQAQFNLQNQQAGQRSLGGIGGQLAPNALDQVQQEAFTRNQTQGMDKGQVATSALIQQLAQQPLGQDMLPALAQGFQIRNATGQTPFGFAQDQAGIAAGMAPAAASIAGGLTPNANTIVNDQTNRAQILGQLEAAQAGAGSRQSTEATGAQNAFTAMMKGQLDILTSMGKPEFKSETMQSYLWNQYNRMAPMLGLDPIRSSADVEKAKKQVNDSTGNQGSLTGPPTTNGGLAGILGGLVGTTPPGMLPRRP